MNQNKFVVYVRFIYFHIHICGISNGFINFGLSSYLHMKAMTILHAFTNVECWILFDEIKYTLIYVILMEVRFSIVWIKDIVYSILCFLITLCVKHWWEKIWHNFEYILEEIKEIHRLHAYYRTRIIPTLSFENVVIKKNTFTILRILYKNVTILYDIKFKYKLNGLQLFISYKSSS